MNEECIYCLAPLTYLLEIHLVITVDSQQKVSTDVGLESCRDHEDAASR